MCLYKFFPYGGLQRDFLSIAKICLERGHEVDVYTTSWEGKKLEKGKIHIIPAQGYSNHTRMKRFSNRLNALLAKKSYDAIIGFNKLEGLDIYYGADTIFAKQINGKGLLYRILPRYRTYLQLERSIFAPESKTKILILSAKERDSYTSYYGTPRERFEILPPGIPKNRVLSLDGRSIRDEYGVPDDFKIVLVVGSGFKTKGVDRAIKAVGSLPNLIRKKTLLWIIGRGKERGYLKLAKRVGIYNNVKFFGPREDVPQFLNEADLLLHPARKEAAGIVIIEAMCVGLPVLVTGVCGYAEHVRKAQAGRIVEIPFQQGQLNKLLLEMLNDPRLKDMGERGKGYIYENGFFELHERVVDIIEQYVLKLTGGTILVT